MNTVFFIIIFVCIFLLLFLISGYIQINLFLRRTEKNAQVGKPVNDEIKKLIEILEPINQKALEWKKNVSVVPWSLITKDNLRLFADLYVAQNRSSTEEEKEDENYKENKTDKNIQKITVGQKHEKIKSHLWVILAHAYKGYRTEMDKFAMHYSQWGFNCLIPDMRSHGDSDGKWIGMGVLDASDLLLWIKKIIKTDSKAKIVLHGQSMGAAAVMCVGKYRNLKNVVCIVEDSGYANIKDVFTSIYRSVHLPIFPFIYSASFVSHLVAGYSFFKNSAKKCLQKCDIPILFLHGVADKTVDVHALDKLVASHKGEHEVVRFSDCGHIMAVAIKEDLYFNSVKNFIFKWI